MVIYSLTSKFYNKKSFLMRKEVSKNILRKIAFHVDKYKVYKNNVYIHVTVNHVITILQV